MVTTLSFGRPKPPAGKESILVEAKRVIVGKKRPIQIRGTAEGMSAGTRLQVFLKPAGTRAFRKGPVAVVSKSGTFSVRTNTSKAVQIQVRSASGTVSNTVTVR